MNSISTDISSSVPKDRRYSKLVSLNCVFTLKQYKDNSNKLWRQSIKKHYETRFEILIKFLAVENWSPLWTPVYKETVQTVK